ncbi:MAG: hypothetical protein HC789_23275 [Microcoleus sp. CSU_2_2]|nr:hypothetical protein [Microcoleus sp. SU_5_3]NJS13081.1 hypothetical protein [Microcoleus sp. CSU_2_2]
MPKITVKEEISSFYESADLDDPSNSEYNYYEQNELSLTLHLVCNTARQFLLACTQK